jgi:hypothetical protein
MVIGTRRKLENIVINLMNDIAIIFFFASTLLVLLLENTFLTLEDTPVIIEMTN